MLIVFVSTKDGKIKKITERMQETIATTLILFMKVSETKPFGKIILKQLKSACKSFAFDRLIIYYMTFLLKYVGMGYIYESPAMFYYVVMLKN